MDTNTLLNEREKTHGSFDDNSRLSQDMKNLVRSYEGWSNLKSNQREALDMILCKIARAINGNPNEPDHWKDIAGYATLALPKPKGNEPAKIAPCAKCGEGFSYNEPIQQQQGKNYHQSCWTKLCQTT